MLPWFLRRPERLAAERQGIEALSQSAGWLVGHVWQLEDDLCLDAVVRAHDHDYELRVKFPSFYPDAPSVVYPRNMRVRLSQHQYGGADGPLCLEWGPDNWHRDVTAAMMLTSAYRLLDAENPMGLDKSEAQIDVPSRHQLTIGQELRGEWARWHYGTALEAYFKTQPLAARGSFRFSFRSLADNWTALVHSAALLDGGMAWTDPDVPQTIPGAEPDALYCGAWFKTELTSSVLLSVGDLEALRRVLIPLDGMTLLARDGTSPIEGLQRSIAGALVCDKQDMLHLFTILPRNSLVHCATIREEQVANNLRAPDHAVLEHEKVGIVGLGSAGSKIALALARMGVRSFYLVDHDLMMASNLQRHALDWQSVGQHKVDAAAKALSLVAASAEVKTSRIHLTGQESNAAISGVLQRLSACDLIIDATANSRVFNLLAAVTTEADISMVWLEVFGGGIGGMMARSRPGLDPSPQDMRVSYLQYCSDNPAPPALRKSADYAVSGTKGEVLVASDADIGVIAHHAARFASDCMTFPESSQYPYSMYLIGLTEAWVFDAPFAAIPISPSAPSRSERQAEALPALRTEDEAFLSQLFKEKDDGPTSAS